MIFSFRVYSETDAHHTPARIKKLSKRTMVKRIAKLHLFQAAASSRIGPRQFNPGFQQN
jgi:hypothetical protein